MASFTTNTAVARELMAQHSFYDAESEYEGTYDLQTLGIQGRSTHYFFMHAPNNDVKFIRTGEAAPIRHAVREIYNATKEYCEEIGGVLMERKATHRDLEDWREGLCSDPQKEIGVYFTYRLSPLGLHTRRRLEYIC